MNDFEWDSLQKKRIAKQEKYHNRKKRGCSLPSDRLTEAQIRKLHGEVTVLDLNKPISYEDYKTMTPELQEMYYNHIVSEFGVGCPAIAEMMGVSEVALRTHNKTTGLQIKKGKAGGAGQKLQEVFRQWWQTETDPYDEIQQELEQRALESVNEETSQLKRLAFEWHGVEDISDILRFLGNLPLPRNARVRVTIEEGKDGQMD